MIHRKSILGFNAVAALVMVVASATTLPIGSTVLDAQAQMQTHRNRLEII